MAATTLVQTVLYRACVLLRDSNPQWERWTENELVEWLNEGQEQVAKFLPFSSAMVAAVKLAAGTRQSIESIATADIKPADGSTPTAAVRGKQLLGVICNMGADGLTRGNVIRIVSQGMLDRYSAAWHTATATDNPTEYVHDPRIPKMFYVSPPINANRWVEMSMTVSPQPVPNTGSAGSELYTRGGGSTTVISIDDQFADDLVNYIVARGYLKDGEGFNLNLATVHTNLFIQSINMQVQAHTGQNPNLKTLPMNPGVPASAQV